MTRKAVFWMVCHLLYEPSLIEAIRAKTSPAFGLDGSLTDLSHIYQHRPQLEAAWFETMRMFGVSASV
jgi:hypothetical protein